MEAWRAKSRGGRMMGDLPGMPVRRRSGMAQPQMRDQDLRTARISVAVPLPELDARMRPVRSGVQPVRTTRMDRLREEMQRQQRREGRWVTAEGARGLVVFIALLVLAAVLMGIWINARYQANLAAAQNLELVAHIQELESTKANLQQKLEEKTAGIVVGYNAVEIGMMNPQNAEIQRLTVPDGAVLQRNRDTAASAW